MREREREREVVHTYIHRYTHTHPHTHTHAWPHNHRLHPINPYHLFSRVQQEPQHLTSSAGKSNIIQHWSHQTTLPPFLLPLHSLLYFSFPLSVSLPPSLLSPSLPSCSFPPFFLPPSLPLFFFPSSFSHTLSFSLSYSLLSFFFLPSLSVFFLSSFLPRSHSPFLPSFSFSPFLPPAHKKKVENWKQNLIYIILSEQREKKRDKGRRQHACGLLVKEG